MVLVLGVQQSDSITHTCVYGQHRNQMIIFFAAKDGEALYSQQK